MRKLWIGCAAGVLFLTVGAGVVVHHQNREAAAAADDADHKAKMAALDARLAAMEADAHAKTMAAVQRLNDSREDTENVIKLMNAGYSPEQARDIVAKSIEQSKQRFGN